MWKSGPHASKQQLSLQQQLTQQRVVIAAMRQQHADELSLLREAHDAEVATLRATVSELRVGEPIIHPAGQRISPTT